MSKAKEEYERAKVHPYGGITEEARNYIKELEEQNKEMKDLVLHIENEYEFELPPLILKQITEVTNE